MRATCRSSAVAFCRPAIPLLLLLVACLTPLTLSSSDPPVSSFAASLSSRSLSPSVSSAAACLNDCSGRGVCSSAQLCQCSAGHLGADCSLVASMAPLCWSSDAKGSLCAQWQLDSHNIYFRIQAQTNPTGGTGTASGWAGMLFGATSDGMTNGTGFYVAVDPTSQKPAVVDIYATRRGRPATATVQTAVNVTGFANSTAIDVSFQRALAAVDAQHYAISASAGVTSVVSVGTAASTFSHHAWAQQVSIDIAAAAAAATTGCLNQCSGHGTCATVGTSNLCQCAAGYLGADCSIGSSMAPMCWSGQGGSMCAQWQLDAHNAYFRITAVTNPTSGSGSAAGWAGMLFGTADDGMSGGMGVYVYINSTSQLPAVVDVIAAKPGRPAVATLQTASNVTGFANSTAIDVSFQRALAAVDAQHYAIPAVSGTPTAVSVATAPTTFSHHVWAQRVSVDIAAAASTPVSGCLNQCSGHGSCSPEGTCVCDANYLATDCHLPSIMEPLCANDASAQAGAYCMYWRIVDGIYYHRIIALTNPTPAPNSAASGWAGVLWDSQDGQMAQGKVVVVSVPEPYKPAVWEMYAADEEQPDLTDVQTIKPYNVTGWSNGTTIDVSFQRYCHVNLTQHYSIPTLVGDTTSVGVAWHNESWDSGDQHLWAQSLGKLDLVATMDPSASCVNGCSGNGRCVGSGSNAHCHCKDSWLGVDCSVSSSMQQQCWQGANNTGSMCARWQLDSQNIYVRIVAVTNPTGGSNGSMAAGWAGMLFGATTDGMTNGTGFYVFVDPTSQKPAVVDIFATRRGRPSAATVQTAINVTGFANSTAIDVSFQRPLSAVDAQHYAISASAGVTTVVSVATAPTTFSHHAWATQVEVDFAAAAAGPGCLNDCSGHGECKSSVCQCEEGRLGADCSMEAAFSRCPFNGDFCFYWTILDSLLYMRVRAAITATGWAGLMFHPGADGMSNGQLLLFTPLDGSTPAAVTEMYSTGRVTPRRVNTTQLVTPANVTAYNTATHSDVSFVRPCHPTDQSLLSIETAPGVSVEMSWAIVASGGFSQHSVDNNVVGRFTVDWVSGDVTIAQSKLLNYYLPIIVMLGVIVCAGLILRLPFVVHSTVGRCCLRKRVSSIGANAYELSSKHAAEKTPLTYSPDDDAALVVQSDDSRTITNHTAALFSALDFATLNVVSTLYHMTVGELLVVLLYVACMAEFALLARRTLQLDVVFGHLTAINLTLAVLPVTRRSVWHFAFGLSFERAIKWHRFVARMAVLSMLIHAAILVYSNGLQVLFHTTPLPAGIAAIYGTLAGACMLLMSLSAFEPIRRRVFELFWYVHVPLFLSTIVFAALHSMYARYYLIAPVGLYAIDWLLRFSNTARSVAVVESAVLSDAAESWRVGRLTVSASMTPKAGQYVFINLPAVSLLQWHPFSVSSVPEPFAAGSGSTFSVHMLDMGKSTFTNDACNLIASSAYANQPIQVRLDGPFGNLSIPHTDYPTLVFVAGGIGFTPVASLLGEVLASDRQWRIYVVWSCRHSDYFYSLFPDLLSQLQRDSRVSLHLFDTGSRGSARVVRSGMDDSLLARDSLQLPEEKHQHIDTLSTGSTSSSFASTGVAALGQPHLRLDVSSGRPHLPALFSRVAREHAGLEENRGRGRTSGSGSGLVGAAGVGVVSCGPSALLADVEAESMRFGYHYHQEVFLL